MGIDRLHAPSGPSLASSASSPVPTASGERETVPDWKGTERYEVLRRLGEGGMGIVYEAFDRERGQSVALKTLLHFSPSALYRFKQEFRTLADVHHPNLVRLHELVVTGEDRAFFAMELVRGTDFVAHVQGAGWQRSTDPPALTANDGARRASSRPRPEGPSLPTLATSERPRPGARASPADWSKLRPALRQLAEGVQALHAAGKLHRDIKPSNVLVTPDGRVVLLDFGVALELARAADENLGEQHEIVGTARYMAPEQALDEVPTAASDWYSVGVMLYEALVGSPPFGGSVTEVLTLKSTMEASPPHERIEGIPDDLDWLCQELLRRDPEERVAGAEVLRRLGARHSSHPRQSSRPGARPTSGTGDDAGKSAPLVGRESQLHALRDAFDTARSGHSVAVRVSGGSGMGKSALVQHFLDEVERGEAVVLRGRAYERETVPYKAFDSVVDALSRYLIRLDERGEGADLPVGIGALAHVFPVLRRVPSIGEQGTVAIDDPQRLRQIAFLALRELLSSLAKRKPLVVYVDDAQWGDADSAALLLELVRPPEAPPLLVLLAHRQDDADTGAFLLETSARWPERADMRELVVGPLSRDEACRLAIQLLDSNSEASRQRAEGIADESGGSPFLVEELARSTSAIHRAPGAAPPVGSVTLEQMIRGRLERIPGEARRLLEIIAIGGRPVRVSLVAEAAGVAAPADEIVSQLRERRFVRTGLRQGHETVEPSNDRIRDELVSQLSGDAIRDCHDRLARVLEASPDADAEAIAVHLLGAGEKARAAQYAERAAEVAASKLAFEQAARLFRLTLDGIGPSATNASAIRVRLAQVLEWSGRSAEAARVYQEAAAGAPRLERAELERKAAVEFLASGQLEEGTAVLHRVLAEVGLSAPTSQLGAVFWLLVYRLRLSLWSLFGARFEGRAPDRVGPEARARIEAVFAASIGFVNTNVILGTCMTARNLVMALRAGDRFQLLRAVLLEASARASLGGSPSRLERSLVRIATGLAEQHDETTATKFLQGNLGVSIYLRGHWTSALDMLNESSSGDPMQDHKAGWRSNAHVYACWSLNFLGRYRELVRRHAQLLAEAERCGDMYTSVQLRAGSLAIVWLVADDPHAARRNAEEAIALWPRDRYLLQHWHMMYGEGEIELYMGNGARAYARVERDAHALKESLLLKVQHMRAQTEFLRGRCAVASLDAEPALRASRLAETRRLAARLEDARMGWTAPFAAILRAAAANADGDRPGAIASLKDAIDLAKTADMTGYEMAARYQLGLLVGGDDGAKMVAAAEGAMKDEGIRAPARFAATLVPGAWGAESSRSRR